MKFSDLPLNPTPRMLRQFAGAWLILFLALGLRAAMSHNRMLLGGILAGMALIGIVGLFKPRAIRWLFIAATVAAFPIGWCVTQAALAILFFVILTPLAWVFRLRGRDLLNLHPPQAGTSLWVNRADPPEPGRYLKQF